jgi:hypothetical protein
MQHVSKLNLTRGTAAYTAAMQAELVTQQQQELQTLKQTGYEARKNYVRLQGVLVSKQQAVADAISNGASKKKIAQLRHEISLTASKIAAAKSETIAIAQNIRAKQAEIAANTGNVASTNILTIAKNKLTAATLRLKAAIMANPYALITAAVVALGYGIYKLVTYQTQAEKVMKDLNKELGAEEALLNKLI